jgi:hypothetical protein
MNANVRTTMRSPCPVGVMPGQGRDAEVAPHTLNGSPTQIGRPSGRPLRALNLLIPNVVVAVRVVVGAARPAAAAETAARNRMGRDRERRASR